MPAELAIVHFLTKCPPDPMPILLAQDRSQLASSIRRDWKKNKKNIYIENKECDHNPCSALMYYVLSPESGSCCSPPAIGPPLFSWEVRTIAAFVYYCILKLENLYCYPRSS